jgi:RNA polymerase sigma-70 factor (ECF subfamily)
VGAPSHANLATGLDVAALYRRFGALVLRRARRLVGEADAEEIAHEVFLRALEHGEAFRGESSPTTWLYRVTTRLGLNRLRDAKRRADLLARHGPTVWDPGDGGERSEARAFLGQLWQTLDEELAMIGLLHYIDGMTTAEIGRLMGVSDRTIANRLRQLSDAARQAAGEAP